MESIHNMLHFYTKLPNSFWEEVFTTSKNYLVRGSMVYSKLLGSSSNVDLISIPLSTSLTYLISAYVS
jgi:hypothetical protein